MRTLVLFALLPVLGGCLKPMEGFPSLAQRTVETRQRESEAPAPPAEPVYDAALASQLTELERTALAGHGRFEQALPLAQARADAARGTQQLSEEWAAAQAALSDLDAQRRDTAIAAANIDRLLVERSMAEAGGSVPPGGSVQIAESQGRVQTILAEQQAALDSLRRELVEE